MSVSRESSDVDEDDEQYSSDLVDEEHSEESLEDRRSFDGSPEMSVARDSSDENKNDATYSSDVGDEEDSEESLEESLNRTLCQCRGCLAGGCQNIVSEWCRRCPRWRCCQPNCPGHSNMSSKHEHSELTSAWKNLFFTMQPQPSGKRSREEMEEVVAASSLNPLAAEFLPSKKMKFSD